MSATVAAALKKIAVAILTDKKLRNITWILMIKPKTVKQVKRELGAK